jgi:hypothetical protein
MTPDFTPNTPPLATPSKSVQFNTPPAPIMPDLRRSIESELAKLGPKEKGALVLVGTKDGNEVKFNAAVVARFNKGWAVQAWVGKTWGQEVAGGATVMKTW